MRHFKEQEGLLRENPPNASILRACRKWYGQDSPCHIPFTHSSFTHSGAIIDKDELNTYVLAELSILQSITHYKYFFMPIELAVSLIFFSAGLIQGVSGFGAALLSMPLLVMVVDVREAVTLSLLNGLIINLFLSVQLKNHLDWRKILPLIIGCLPGIYVGVSLLTRMNPAIMKGSLGVLIAAYAIYCLAGRMTNLHIGRAWAYVAGFAAGTLGSAFSTGGPPVIIYTTLTGWNKDQIKATLSSFFLFITVLSVGAHAVNGLTTPHVLRLFSVTALPVLAGVFLGSQFYKRLATKTYLTIIYYLLIGLGIMLIISGLN
jgi:uncharacterized membrane protein YfcA